jgi:hypothetical protein
MKIFKKYKMNIFFLYKNPERNASYYYNRHVVKIILEIAQLLYTALHSHLHLIETDLVAYKSTHVKHPMSIWVSKSKANTLYVFEIGFALCQEYTRRYKKIHACQKHLDYLKKIVDHPDFAYNSSTDYLPQTFLAHLDDELTPVPLCMPVEYHSSSVIDSYRHYYIFDKFKICGKTETPIQEFTIDE